MHKLAILVTFATLILSAHSATPPPQTTINLADTDVLKIEVLSFVLMCRPVCPQLLRIRMYKKLHSPARSSGSPSTTLSVSLEILSSSHKTISTSP